ncbi:hypothetical protein [Acinetobacter indicus]|uniref:hypothetical protein n=1 Tax=Acinetobacter indicus TaxID=756892 RepID=UPI0020903EF0|nr:hypothetical protein [Acinetobacter indicus]
MNQLEFEHALKALLKQPLNSATFEQVKPVAEALLYSELLPAVSSSLNPLAPTVFSIRKIPQILMLKCF